MLINQIRRLTQALMVSGALNIALLALFFYWMVKERPPTTYYQLKPADQEQEQPPLADTRTSKEVIVEYGRMPLEQLIAKLSHAQLVENGYAQRDLALAYLVAFHHFDLSRALSGQSLLLQKRTLSFSSSDEEKKELVIYLGLTEAQFQSIVQFATTEKWPFTSQGLFLLLKEKDNKFEDPSLAEAFYLEPEFLSVETLFKRSEVVLDRKTLLEVILDGDWNMLSTFSEQQKVSQDLSTARRQRFLIDYIARRSKAASYLLLQTDGTFAARKLDDRSIIFILKLLDRETPEARTFALELLSSPRSDAVLRQAAARLYEFAGESIPAAYSHEDALSHFLPKIKAAQKNFPTRPPLAYAPATTIKQTQVSQLKEAKPVAVVAKTDRYYVVQEGDSLWRISRRFKIDIELLRKHNRLQNDFLKPGTMLKLP